VKVFSVILNGFIFYIKGIVMSITYPGFQKANFYLERYGRETFSSDAGQRSRAIIPGDDPGDQQPPERRGLYPDPHAVAANAKLALIRCDRRLR
jgi:hypothetical protein